jgi:lysophospholipase
MPSFVRFRNASQQSELRIEVLPHCPTALLPTLKETIMAIRKLIALAKNPVPSGAVVDTLKARDGSLLRYARWEANQSPRLGTVCLFGGRTEFIEKYFEVIADLRRRGFAVATMDWRGQGGSDRPLANARKAHIGDFSEHDDDLNRFMRQVVLPDCPPPYIGLAHSMGGNILLRAAARPDLWFDRIVLSAPMIRLNQKLLPMSRGMARVASTTASIFGAGKAYAGKGGDDYGETAPFEGNLFTSDRERYTRNNAIVVAEPKLGLGSPTYGWMRAGFRTMRAIAVPGHLAAIRVPVLFVLAGDDSIADSPFIEAYASKVKLSRAITIPYARHEILQERDDLRQQFWAAFDAFVESRPPEMEG